MSHRWTCPKCALSFKTDIDLKEPPICYQHKSGKPEKMELQKPKEKK